MKNSFILISIFFITNLFGQSFDDRWNTVIQFENEGKIKSAHEEVKKIYKKANNKKDEVQIIKCFFYNSKYILTLEENAQSTVLTNLKKEISRASVPSKSILNVVYAKCLNDYYNQNRYKISNRTITDTVSDDFLIWTRADFDKIIQNAYSKSLENEYTLKQTSLSKYEAIFDFQNQDNFKKQSVLEYIFTENVKYYTSKISTWEINAVDFANYKERLLGDSNDFVHVNFDLVKNNNLRETLVLYQKLETISPTIENQLDRIKFVKGYIIKSDGYVLTALNSLQKRADSDVIIKKIQLEKALFYSNLASKTIHPDYNSIAVSILDSLLIKNDHSNTYKLAESKKQEIVLKSLNINLQKYIYDKENTRAFIQYKNVDQLNFKFYKIKKKELLELAGQNSKNDSLVQDLVAKNKPFKTAFYKLVNKGDFFSYSTEVLLPQLETGNYLVYFDSDGSSGQKAYGFDTIAVTNFVLSSDRNFNTITYQVLDRKTGFPVESATLKSECFDLKTDRDGKARYQVIKDKKFKDFSIEIAKANDTVQLVVRNSYMYNYYSESDSEVEDEEFKAKVKFYLDRAIYRPGQKVYYKGIAFQQKKDKINVVPNLKLKVILEDANYEEIKELELTTNEYGSFSGEFILPKSCVTGRFKIIADEPDNLENDPNYDKKNEEHPFWDNLDEFEDSEVDFRVEEYKRPKFEVNFDPIKELFLVNQNVIVKGSVKAFAGSNVADSKVDYSVRRTTRFINSAQYRVYDESEIIATSKTKTDAYGNFVIEFTAKPSEKGKKEDLPIYTYTVEASVTDLTGETQSNKTMVKVGYQAMEISTNLPPIIETKNKNNLSLNSTNLNGAFVPVKGELNFYFVDEPSSKFKPRVWSKPEIETISNEDFDKFFPYEKAESKDYKVSAGTLIHTQKVDTQHEKSILLDFLEGQKTGYYKVVFTAIDKFNNSIESTTNFQIKQSKDKYEKGKFFSITQLNENPKKDGYVVIKLSSSVPDLYLNAMASYDDNTIKESTIKIKNHNATFKIPIKKEYKNSISVGFQGVYENYEFKDHIDVSIKNEEPKLEFKVSSFRDNIQPGIPENWSFKIKNGKSNSESEVLASMYDISLDHFTTNEWEELSFYKDNSNRIDYKYFAGFDRTNTYLRRLNIDRKSVDLRNEETKLIWFGFDFNKNVSFQSLREYKQQITKKAKKPLNAKMVSGIVTSKTDKMTIPGVSVVVKGTNRGVQTDFDGYYEIEAAPGETLTFSSVGSVTQVISVGNSRELNVELTDEATYLSEVVVEGYDVTRTRAKSNVASVTVSSKTVEGRSNVAFVELLQGQVPGLSVTTGSGQPGANSSVILRGVGSLTEKTEPLYIVDGVPMNFESLKNLNPNEVASVSVLKDGGATAIYGSRAANGVIIVTTQKGMKELTQVKSRTNLSETAFFFPHLKTDKNGTVSFNFTSPEALTSWKLRLMAHQKNAVSGYLEKKVITQKELMVMPNFPRFLRENDSIIITAKVSNITKESKTGNAILQLFDASNMNTIDVEANNVNNVKNFMIGPFDNTTVSWKIYIPQGLQGVQYKIVAKSGDFSDGEEGILPVLTNNILVTESIPIWVKGNSKKEYSFENLKNNTSVTLRNHQFTLEYTSNPAWMAIQSLPYLMEYEHECSEQTFARFYANAVATEIINSNQKIATVFENWRKDGKLNSKLEQNEELKSIILAETPWLNDAQSEDEKKSKLALLFDLEKMKSSQETIFEKLKQKQRPSGGFVWFGGDYESEFITSHILAGFGHLKKLNIKAVSNKVEEISKTGIPYLDTRFLKRNSAMQKSMKENKFANSPIKSTELHYLYTRSFYLVDYPLSEDLKKITDLYIKNIRENWLSYPLYQKGLTSLVLYRFGENETARKILINLKETAANNEDWGMYWIENKSGWRWDQAPIETQSLLIEAFTEIEKDRESADEMKVWLLKNKQTKNWPTTKSTTGAVYALLMQGSDWMNVKDNTVIKIGDEKVVTKKLSASEKEAETGYLKLNWQSQEIKKDMASITIENKSKVPGFGGAYWQYFENLDKIKSNSGSPLSVSKELYLKKNTLEGTRLARITSENTVKLGDLVTVRLIITAKESMEYIHLKDMRASCFEPVNVLSEYKYKDGVGYYMSTKDSATHFFFDNINKGTYVLEYDISVNNIGDFSNGITMIESMYAPEYTSHTAGIRVRAVN